MHTSSLLVHAIAHDFSLGRLRRWNRLPNSFVNEKYLLTTSTGMYLAGSSIRTLRQLDFEIALLNHLRGLPVPALVASRDGQYRHTYKEKPFTVYRYIQGVAPRRITATFMQELGRFQARFHVRGTSLRRTVNKEPFTYEFPPAKLRMMHRLFTARIRPEFRRYYPNVYGTVRQVKRFRHLPRGPIHVDIKPDNVLMRKGRLAGVIDFGNCYRGPLLVDIAKTLVWFCLRKGRMDERRVAAFLEAYERVRPLTKPERREFSFALQFAAASHIFIDYYTYLHKIVPLSYLRFLHRKFLGFVAERLHERAADDL